jgi:hypothetical protein
MRGLFPLHYKSGQDWFEVQVLRLTVNYSSTRSQVVTPECHKERKKQQTKCSIF